MYHEFMQLIEGAKGAFPAARNTNLPCIPATRIETKPWSLFGEESEAQLLANFTEYTERNDLQLLLWTFCNQKGDIALVCSKTMGGNHCTRDRKSLALCATSLPTLASRCNVR